MVLHVSALEVRHGRDCVVRGVSFGAARGERVVIMGPSGAGKSTILRAIAGLEPVAGGAIDLAGIRLQSKATAADVRALRRQVGMVFQFHHLFSHMNVLQNVSLAPVHVLGLTREEAERAAVALLDRLGVGLRAAAMPHELSGGEAQRVAIARALAMQPPLLLLDEPTASLDPGRRGELSQTLRALSSDGTTLVIASHDVEFARTCADRIVVLESGRITRQGTAADVLS